MLKPSSLAKWGVAALLLSSLTSCEDILEQYFPKPNPTPPTIPTFPPLGQDIAFYALSGGTRLDAYNTSNAASRTSSVALTGLGSGETLLAIDFRPATGQLYGVSSASRLYVINQNTGAARAIGSGAFTPAVAGNLVGFDFNPTVDRIRLVTSTGQNLRLNPETGAVAATDGSLNGAAGAMVTGAAYTNNTAGASTTALYAINTQNQQLYLVNPPNDGTLVPVGSLNLNISGDGGFDIDAKTGTALGLYSVQGKPTLFTVDLTTGAARPLAEYATNSGYSGIAIPTRPVAYALNLAQGIRGGTLNDLYIIDPTNPSTSVYKSVTGLKENEGIVGMDFRPATGQLYALTNTSELYVLNLATGAATKVATLSVPLAAGPVGVANGRGFDFNPVVDRIRIVTASGQNLRVNPADGMTTVDGRINPGTPSILAAGYDNNFAGTTTTTLYVLDGNGKLYRQSPPNDGTLVEIGNTGIPNVSNFDIGGSTNTGYIYTATGGGGTAILISTINVTTGAVTSSTQGFNAGGFPTAFAVGLGF
ncbi:DUF4394 domain-containing protein [Hymenobacter sp. HDW8]|uniref:DUF4394 domain-containing protein n=1 Tax=Hymenobacter sp. HDW8 TaxID=2714932 RepID=UPI00140C2170|nr:DUF4394 domain-containing protein [Hymenobacter sp. HDW8]QIL74565.1 DUF4394 domain-containing protein [Hymenobacter sp. HDW8]